MKHDNRIRIIREQKKLSLEELGSRVGKSPSYLSRIELSERNLSVKLMHRIAGALGVEPTELISPASDIIALTESGTTMAEAKLPTREVSGPFMLQPDSDNKMPIYGSARGGEGAIVFDGDPVEWVQTPSNLVGVKRAYGVYVRGESMIPRANPGERLDVHPGKPPKRGNTVIVQLLPEEPGGDYEVFVKLYERLTGTHLVVSQLNPVREIEFPLDRVQAVHVVIAIHDD